MNFQDLFKLGMKRKLMPLLEFPGKIYNLGSSPNDFFQIPGAIPLGLPDWEWPFTKFLLMDKKVGIPELDGTVATIHCYHFLEHLKGEDAISLLRECERVMIPGASVLNFCMPYYNSNLQAECLDHKSAWNENSFRNLFENSGFDMGTWALRTHFIMIAGIDERNLCIIGQLVRK
jgi:hypothetical protein